MQFRPTISTARSRLGDIVHWRTSGPAKAITLTARLAIAMIMLVYLVISLLISLFMNMYNRAVALVER